MVKISTSRNASRGISTPLVIIVVLIVIVAACVLIFRGGGAPPGNVLRMIQSTDANSLDVDRTKMDQAMQVIALTQDTLMTYDWDMNYIPLLAENWEIGENGLYIDWHLKENVKFQCGEPFNAAAVVYSIRRAKSAWSVQSDTVRNILDAEVLDEYTARIYLVQWDRWLYDWFAETSSSIVCPVCGDDPAYGVSKFCGTGPFKITEWVRDTRITLARNNNYTWGPEIYQNRGPAHLDGITIEVDANNLTSEEKFFRGDVDLMIGISPRSALIERLQTDPNVFDNFIYPRSSMSWIGFNVSSLSPEIQQSIPSDHTESPVNDDRPWLQVDGVMTPDNANKGLLVRKALLYATNKEDLLLYAWQGLGKIAYGPLTSLMWGYNSAVENMYPYDLEMAENLLAQAGYSGGSPTNLVLHLTILTTNYEPYVKECETLREQWKQVGVDLEISVRAFDDIESIIAKGQNELFTGGYTWPNADMLWWYWHTTRVPPSPNRFWWGNGYADNVIDNTFSYSDAVAFKAIQESQMQVMEDAVYLPIVERPFLMPIRVDVKGLGVHPMSNFIWKQLDTYLER